MSNISVEKLLDPTPTGDAFFQVDKLQYENNIPMDKVTGRKIMVILDPSISKKKGSDYCVSMVVETFMYNKLLHMNVLERFVKAEYE